jgi:hypothetical protein
MGELTSKLVSVFTYIAWAIFLAAIIAMWNMGSGSMSGALSALQQTQSSFLQLVFLMVFVVPASIVPAFMLAAYLILFFLPFILVSPLTIPLAITWKNPFRLLILRPFNRLDASKALRQIIRTEISAFGHCYALADADLRVSLWHRLPILYGQLTFFTFRQNRVASPRHPGKLLKNLHARKRRNINWAVSRDKIFPVACVDAGWQACVTRLVDELLQKSFEPDFVPVLLGYDPAGLKRTGSLRKAVSKLLSQETD